MNNPFVSRIGGVMSADIAVPDHEIERHFYARVLTTGAEPLWRDDLMNGDGVPVIGLGAQSPEFPDLPLQWMPHIQVADIARSVERALALGGEELLHGRDDDGNSQWAVLLDPVGAAFGLIPVVPAEALPPVDSENSQNGPSPMGCIAWLDLSVTHASTLRDFYQQVVGWSVEAVDMTHDGASYPDFNMIAGDGKPAAGICHARGANASLPPQWLIYLPVGDLGESLGRVREEGGEIVQEVMGDDGVPAYAVIRDPVGAFFGLLSS